MNFFPLLSISGCLQASVASSLNATFAAVRLKRLLYVLVFGALQSAAARVIYQETFSGDVGQALNGTAPATAPQGSAAVWKAASPFNKGGVIAATSTNKAGSAWLPYAFETPGVYEVSLIFTMASGTAESNMMGVAFTQRQPPFSASSFGTANGSDGPNAAPALIVRQTGGYLASRTAAFGNVLVSDSANPGPFKSSINGGAIKLSLILDTTGTAYTLNGFINAVQLDLNGSAPGSTYVFFGNPQLTGVGLNYQNTPAVTLTDFTLRVVSEPSVAVSSSGSTLDTYLDSANPQRNYGLSPSLKVGAGSSGDVYKALLRFDLNGQVPSDAVILAAKLRMKCTGGPGTNAVTLQARRMLAAWNEGNKNGGTASAFEPTNSHQLYNSVAWEWNSDQSKEIDGETVMAAGTASGWVEIDVTSAVRAWVADPLSNKGVIISASGTGGGTVRTFASSEAPASADQPVLFVTFESPLTESTEATGGSPRLVVGISHSLPRKNTVVTLRARTPGWSEGSIDYQFTAIPFNFTGAAINLGTQSVTGQAIAQKDWTPQKGGLYNVRVEAKKNGITRFVRTMRVAVLSSTAKLHFPYSIASLAEKGKYVTAVDGASRPPFWRARGAQPLTWHPGSNYVRDFGWNASSLLGDWNSRWNSSNPTDGFLIDELLGNNHDITTAEAMLSYRTSHPERAIYPFSIALHNHATVRAAYQNAADVIQVETYVPQPSLYSLITQRYDPFKTLHPEKAICTQYLAWIPSRTEYRRQVRYFRRNWPQMRGMGVYGNSNVDAVRRTVDETIEDYFLGPVIFPKFDGNAVRLENIGHTDAAKFDAVCYNASGQEVDRRTFTSGLASQAVQTYTKPTNSTRIAIDKRGPWTNVVDEHENYASLPEGKMQPLTIRAASSTSQQDFSANPNMSIYRNSGDQVIWGQYAIPNMANSMTFSFDINFSLIQFYGKITVGVANTGNGSALRMSFYQGDSEAGLTGCRTTMEYIDPSGGSVSDQMYRVLQPGNTYRCILHYERGKFVRGVVKQGEIRLWDSGELGIAGLGNLSVNRVRFDVRPHSSPASNISWSTGTQNISLRGSAGANYVLEAVVDNVRQDYFNQQELFGAMQQQEGGGGSLTAPQVLKVYSVISGGDGSGHQMELTTTDGDPKVDARSNPKGDSTIVFVFDRKVEEAEALLTAVAGEIARTEIVDKEVHIHLKGILDAQPVMVELVSKTRASADLSRVIFKTLQGDVNGDGAVDDEDWELAKRHRSLMPSSKDRRFDLNMDGTFDEKDLLLIRSRKGNALTDC